MNNWLKYIQRFAMIHTKILWGFDKSVHFLLVLPFSIFLNFLHNESITSPLRRAWPSSRSDRTLHTLFGIRSSRSYSSVRSFDWSTWPLPPLASFPRQIARHRASLRSCCWEGPRCSLGRLRSRHLGYMGHTHSLILSYEIARVPQFLFR